ncbi:MAG: twin-arginine translocase subunit TatC [Planctomycetales bacterium]
MTKRDLFDDSTMTFGEHLEALRRHLILALMGLAIAIIFTLIFARPVLRVIQIPVQSALRNAWKRYDERNETEKSAETKMNPVYRTWRDLWAGSVKDFPIPKPEKKGTVTAALDVVALMRAMHELNPQSPAPPKEGSKVIDVQIPAESIAGAVPRKESLADTALGMTTTLSPEEGFLIYMKVALISGFVLASPWVFYQLWLFVAAGLYPTERNYVYTYLPLSLTLFFSGTLFCFVIVLPYVLDFLFDFNIYLEIMPQIRISEYLSFALILPVMFGISFELPLVMLILERISIVKVKDYQEKRRFAILIMSIIAMVLTPSDPMSMMLMLIPLCLLYEMGIWMCKLQGPRPAFDSATT